MADPAPTDRRQIQPVSPVLLPERDRPGMHLPVPLTSFVSREREISVVIELLRRPSVRLITLTGPGGVGKTRLAIRVAEEVAEEFPNGLWFVAFAAVRDPALVNTTIAHALGVRETATQSVEEGMQKVLRGRRALLVVDNFEHLLEAGSLFADLLATCPSLAVLVTSRAVLHLSGEHDVPVPPLSLPPADIVGGDDRLHDSAAVRLFVERATEVDPGFALTPESGPAVAAIVRRLDGLPLAIELAATRTRVLPPAALLSRLATRLPLLGGGPRDQPARLRTMRHAIAWSYDLLASSEQALFRRLAVFVGGFTLEAATAVGGTGAPAADILVGVESLVEQSLVHRLDVVAGEPRFGMLETVREFGLEELGAIGEAEAVQARHAAVMARFAEETAPPWKPPSALAFVRLATEQDNARGALAWSVERGEAELGLRVAASYFRLWQLHGHLAEGRRWLGQLLALADSAPPSLRAAAFLGAGLFSLAGAGVFAVGDGAAAEPAYQEALAIVRALPPGPELPLVLIHLGDVAYDRGDLGKAEARYQEALEWARATGNDDWSFRALGGLGRVAADRGDVARAVALVEEAVAMCRGAEVPWGLAAMLGSLSHLARRQGDRRRAVPLDRERLAISRELGATVYLADCALVAAEAAVWLLQPERAAHLLGVASKLLEDYGVRITPDLQRELDVASHAARGALGEASFVAAWAAGRELPLDVAIADADAVFAAEEQSSPSAATRSVPETDPAARSGLSPRELEVVRLLAAGRSNREIADALFVSHGTATTHVRNILAKLDLTSRTAVAVWAIRHGLA
ncbi:MAG: tetratricopeptide repeat protein [Chloroflexota bacterium]|nr:tetratricopeptide repeat protein [Chloroflexota bacterium]